jgi:hypothetical protein
MTTNHRKSPSLAAIRDAQIARLAAVEHARAVIDAILRGQHDGWDQALAKLRNDLRAALQATEDSL